MLLLSTFCKPWNSSKSKNMGYDLTLSLDLIVEICWLRTHLDSWFKLTWFHYQTSSYLKIVKHVSRVKLYIGIDKSFCNLSIHFRANLCHHQSNSKLLVWWNFFLFLFFRIIFFMKLSITVNNQETFHYTYCSILSIVLHLWHQI